MGSLSAVESLALLGRELVGLKRAAGAYALLRYGLGLVSALPEVLRQRSLGPGDASMGGRCWTFDVAGVSVIVDGSSFGGARELYVRKLYLPSPEFRIRAGDRVVDLGSNAGLFSIFAAASGARVVAVDAQSGFAAAVDENARRNRCRDRITFEAAMVGSGGAFSAPEDALRGSHGEVVPAVMTMDELMTRHALDRIDFLKCDIEGAEFALFREPAPWLDRVERIAMEVHPEFGDVAAVASLLRARGFRVQVTDDKLRPSSHLSEKGGYIFAHRAAA